MTQTDALAFLILLAGSFSQAITGVGHGMIAMAALPYLFPYKDCLNIIRISGICFIFPIFFNHRVRDVKWKILAVPILTGSIGTYFATLILMDGRFETSLRMLLGVLIAFMGLYSLLSRKTLRFRPTLLAGTLAGAIVGFFGTACGVSGPPLALYYLNIDSMREDKNAYYATIMVTFQLMAAVQLVMMAAKGGMTFASLVLSAKAVVPTLIGIVTGRYLYGKLNISLIKKILYLFIVGMGVVVIVTTAWSSGA